MSAPVAKNISAIEAPTSSAFEHAAGDARILGLGDLLKPREVAKPVAVVAPTVTSEPDPRVLLEYERKRTLDAARKEGHEAGMRDAEKEIESRAKAAEREWEERYRKETERLAETTRRLQVLVGSLPDAITDIEQQVEALTIEATFAATTRVVAEAARGEAMVLGFCREALTEYALRPVTLRVHPDALSAVKAALADSEVRVEGDVRLAAGQCRIESAKGLYDISLEHRLEALRQQLLASLGGANADEVSRA